MHDKRVFWYILASLLFLLAARRARGLPSCQNGPNGSEPKFIEIPLKMVANEWYYAEVLIGAPVQRARLFVDTRYADSWILSEGYANCHSHNCYNATQSATSDARRTLLQLQGDLVSGHEQEDSWILGNRTLGRVPFIGANGFLRKSQDNGLFFAPRTKATSLGAPKTPSLYYDGFLGIGKCRQAGDGVTQLMERLKKFAYIDRLQMAIYTRHTHTIEAHATGQPRDGGKVLIGSFDNLMMLGDSSQATVVPIIRAECENFTPKAPISGDFYFYLNNFSCSTGFELAQNRSLAVLSTRHTYIGVPLSLLELIGKQTNGSLVSLNGSAQTSETTSVELEDCSTNRLPSFSFGMGSKRLLLEPRDYALKIEQTNRCRLAFVLHEPNCNSRAQFTFGTYFMSLYYTVFNFEPNKEEFVQFSRISFAADQDNGAHHHS